MPAILEDGHLEPRCLFSALCCPLPNMTIILLPAGGGQSYIYQRRNTLAVKSRPENKVVDYFHPSPLHDCRE